MKELKPDHPSGPLGLSLQKRIIISKDKLKAKFPNVYYGKTHMKYYNFCQQYENYFAIIGAIETNCILFAAFFLWDWINFCWQQHKQKLAEDSFVPITWNEFKTFLRKFLGDSWAFVDNYWAKIKRDSQY